MSDDPFCEDGGLPQSMCDHCRQKTPKLSQGATYAREGDLIPDSEVLARFGARFDKEGGCDYCGGDTEEGEPLCLTESYGYVHEEHCEPKPEPPDHLSLR
jgi:hypothetical protein